METLSVPLLLWPELAAIISYFYQLVNYTLEKLLLAAQVLFLRDFKILAFDTITENQRKEEQRKMKERDKEIMNKRVKLVGRGGKKQYVH